LVYSFRMKLKEKVKVAFTRIWSIRQLNVQLWQDVPLNHSLFLQQAVPFQTLAPEHKVHDVPSSHLLQL
jgi:hypothetical protein